MQTNKRPDGLGILISTVPAGRGSGAATRPRGKRNPWVVAAFFGLVVAAWINALV